jgi:OOP family OmpA-OmpF porin
VRPRRAAALIVAALAPAGAHAFAPEIEAALRAPPGAVVLADETRLADAYAAPVAPFDAEGDFLRPLEGRVWRLAWRLGGPDGTLALTRAARDRLAPLGFETTLFCAAPRCGGYDFRYALEVLPQPAMIVSLADFRQLTMTRRGEGGRDLVVSVLASRLGDDTHVQVVAVEGTDASPAAAPPAAAPAAAPPAAAPASPAAPASGPPPDPAASPGGDLLGRLVAEGRAVLTGVDFLPGSTTLAPEADAALDAWAAALAAAPALAVAVVGHTDTSGALDVNLRVSAARAAAVRDALVARGVARDRLEAAGAGWLAPVATNATGAGRALNRRVELVAR